MASFKEFFYSVLGVKPEPTPVTAAQGTGGIASFGGFLDSKEKNSDLTGPQKYVTYGDVMRNATIVAAAARAHDALITGVGWSLKPGVGPLANQYAERVDQMIKTEQSSQPWNQTIGMLARHKWLGFAVVEKVLEKMPDGFNAYTQFEDRPQFTVEQWDLEPRSGHVNGFIQRDPTTGELTYLERWRCVYMADKSVANTPEGVGMLRHVVETWRELKRLIQLEGWAYETDLRGIPIGTAPIGVLDEMVKRKIITEADKALKLKGLVDFVKNHVRNPSLGIVLDSGVYTDQGPNRTPAVGKMWGLELAKGDGSGLAEINTVIDRKQREMARAIGWEHLMLGGDGKGSNAQHADKTAGVREVMNSTLATIGWQLDHDVIRPVADANGWDRTQLPCFVPDALQLRSVQEIVDALEGMARSGAVILSNDPVVNQVRGMLRLVEQPKIPANVVTALIRPSAAAGGKPGETPPKGTP